MSSHSNASGFPFVLGGLFFLASSVAFAQQLIQGPMMHNPRAPGSAAYPTGRPGASSAANRGEVRSTPPAASPSTAPVVSAATGRRWGLLFAVENYDVTVQELSPLAGCFNDLNAVRNDWFFAQGIPEERIVFLNDRVAESAHRPTRRNFERELSGLLARLGPDDVLYVAIACHGVAAHGKSFLCPLDTLKADFRDVDSPEKALAFGRANNLIPVGELVERLRGARCARKLLILDACRDTGPGSDEKSTDSDFMEEFKAIAQSLYLPGKTDPSGGLAVLTGCSLGQQAHEMIVEDRYHGVFMRFFLDGLAGSADYFGVIDGEITLAEAYAYAFAQTNKYVYQSRDRRRQTPELFRGTDWTRFSLARTKSAEKSGDVESDAEFFVRQGAAFARYGRLPFAVDLLSHVLHYEPNHHVALSIRAGAYLSLGAFPSAGNDYRRLGRTLDLFTVFSDADKARFQRQRSRGGREGARANSADLRILVRESARDEAPVKAELVPGQKVAISRIDGNGLWFRVASIDDKVSDTEIGWIRRENLTWTPDNIEVYRPATPLFTPRVPTGSVGRELGGEGRGRSSVGRAVGRQGAVVRP